MSDVHEVAEQYFECVVDPAVEEILEEYNARDGYEAGVHAKEFLTKNAPDVAEVHGIYVIFPDSTSRFVSVCWPEGSEQVLIGVPGKTGEPFTIDIHDTDKEKLKDILRGVIEV